MKATIDLDDRLYRRLEVEAARRGRTIRDLVQEGVRQVLGLARPVDEQPPAAGEADWFGSLREYASNAGGAHDVGAMRRSIERKRGRRK